MWFRSEQKEASNRENFRERKCLSLLSVLSVDIQSFPLPFLPTPTLLQVPTPPTLQPIPNTTPPLTPPAGSSPIAPALITLYWDSLHLQTSTLFRLCGSGRSSRLVPASSLAQWRQHFSRSEFGLEIKDGKHLVDFLCLPSCPLPSFAGEHMA